MKNKIKLPKKGKGGLIDNWTGYYENGGEYNWEVTPRMSMSEGGILEVKSGGWIKKAINPKHKGYCTPMTKSTWQIEEDTPQFGNGGQTPFELYLQQYQNRPSTDTLSTNVKVNPHPVYTPQELKRIQDLEDARIKTLSPLSLQQLKERYQRDIQKNPEIKKWLDQQQYGSEEPMLNMPFLPANYPIQEFKQGGEVPKIPIPKKEFEKKMVAYNDSANLAAFSDEARKLAMNTNNPSDMDEFNKEYSDYLVGDSNIKPVDKREFKIGNKSYTIPIYKEPVIEPWEIYEPQKGFWDKLEEGASDFNYKLRREARGLIGNKTFRKIDNFGYGIEKGFKNVWKDFTGYFEKNDVMNEGIKSQNIVTPSPQQITNNTPPKGMYYTKDGTLDILPQIKPRPKEKVIQMNSMTPDLLEGTTNIGQINPIPFVKGTYFTRDRQNQELDSEQFGRKGKKDYFDKKTGRIIGTYKDGGKVAKWEIIE